MEKILNFNFDWKMNIKGNQKYEEEINKAMKTLQLTSNQVKEVIMLNQDQDSKSVIYKQLQESGIFLPKFSSNAITKKSLLLHKYSKFIIILSYSKVEQFLKEDFELFQSPNFAFSIIQISLFATTKKCLPYFNTPNKSFVEKIVMCFDPTNQFGLLSKKNNDNITQNCSQTFLLKRNKFLRTEVNTNSEQIFKQFIFLQNNLQKNYWKQIGVSCQLNEIKDQLEKQIQNIDDYCKKLDSLTKVKVQTLPVFKRLEQFSKLNQNNFQEKLVRSYIGDKFDDDIVKTIISQTNKTQQEEQSLNQFFDQSQFFSLKKEKRHELVKQFDFTKIYEKYGFKTLEKLYYFFLDFDITMDQTKQIETIQNIELVKLNIKVTKKQEQIQIQLQNIKKYTTGFSKIGLDRNKVINSLENICIDFGQVTGAQQFQQLEQTHSKINQRLKNFKNLEIIQEGNFNDQIKELKKLVSTQPNFVQKKIDLSFDFEENAQSFQSYKSDGDDQSMVSGFDKINPFQQFNGEEMQIENDEIKPQNKPKTNQAENKMEIENSQEEQKQKTFQENIQRKQKNISSQKIKKQKINKQGSILSSLQGFIFGKKKKRSRSSSSTENKKNED